MPIITFWSNSKKQTGQTMSLTAIATSMAIEHNYKILINLYKRILKLFKI